MMPGIWNRSTSRRRIYAGAAQDDGHGDPKSCPDVHRARHCGVRDRRHGASTATVCFTMDVAMGLVSKPTEDPALVSNRSTFPRPDTAWRCDMTQLTDSFRDC